MRKISDNIKLMEVLKPEGWQLELLKINHGSDELVSGFELHDSSNITYTLFNNWKDFLNFLPSSRLNRGNEIIDYFFEVDKTNSLCKHCNGTGNDFHYLHEVREVELSDTKTITQPELEYFVKGGKIKSASHGRVYFNEQEQNFHSVFNGTFTPIIGDIKYPDLLLINEVINSDDQSEWLGPMDIMSWENIIYVRRKLNDQRTECEACDGLGKLYGGKTNLSLVIVLYQSNFQRIFNLKIKDITREEVDLVLSYLDEANFVITDRIKKMNSRGIVKMGRIKDVTIDWQKYVAESKFKPSTDMKLFTFTNLI